jgi:hypothetical protein
VAHREIPLKVTAWIDEGIAPLVAALNELDGVITLDSCQGHGDDPPAHVFFAYRGDEQDAALFVARLAAQLAPHESEADYDLIAEWRPGAAEPTFQLRCPTPQIGRLAELLSAVGAPAGDMFCTGLRS